MCNEFDTHFICKHAFNVSDKKSEAQRDKIFAPKIRLLDNVLFDN
jgi:hypothetical protein